MEDYTYHLVLGEEKTLGAHMLEVCPSLAADLPSCEIHPLSIGARRDPVRLVFDAAPGPAVVLGLADLGERSGWSPTRSTWCHQTSRCRGCRSRARCDSRARTSGPRPSPG